ncbi:MAG: NapC/NirT family cytochrome c [Actinobacteria bacterium]|nr:NapC/NirT family cytochrome c [Actinomycetota bacterium]
MTDPSPGEPPATEDSRTNLEGPVRRSRRSRKRRRLRLALIIVGALIVVLIGGSFAAAEYTSRSSFCNTCHEMNPYYATWQTSTHSSAQCRDCHIPPGFVPYVQTKLFSFREIWVHITRKVEPPLAVTRKIHDANCLRCHPNPGQKTLGAQTNTTFSHQAHGAQTCISCHVRLVHRTVNPPYYVDPAAMSSCLECHNGTTVASTCSTCHSPPHEARGECGNCHGQQSWSGASFNHPFALTGGHAGLNCSDCHVSKPGVATIPGTDLPKANPACVSCHGDHHKGLTDCANCHTPQGWSPSNFAHPPVGEHIPSGERPLDCSACHPNGYASHSCTPCHQGTPTGD